MLNKGHFHIGTQNLFLFLKIKSGTEGFELLNEELSLQNRHLCLALFLAPRYLTTYSQQSNNITLV